MTGSRQNPASMKKWEEQQWVTMCETHVTAFCKGSRLTGYESRGVVAMITDRSANIYEGAAGARVLGSDQAMTLDSVFAIFSTTKPIAGTAILQCVEDGKLDLDAPAKTYVPDIGKLQVLDGFDDAGKPKLRAPKRDITTRC